MRGRVLVVAGSDSGGGAGLQADLKTVAALGGYAMTAVTALTVQDTLGVHDVLAVPPAFVAAQVARALDDPGADAVKTGMLGDAARIHAVADALDGCGLPLVVDPVMVAKGGARLLDEGAVDALRVRLSGLASLLTPNAPEAAALCGFPVETLDDLHRAAATLLASGWRSVLLKGGHVVGETVTDLLATPHGTSRLQAPRIAGRHTHGTGCTLASAVAVGLAQGMALDAAVDRARAYVRAAIAAAPGFGRGHGPLNHSVADPAGNPTQGSALSQPGAQGPPTAPVR